MHPQISTPYGPVNGAGQAVTTAGANTVASSLIAEAQAFQVWCADDFYLSVETVSTPYAPDATTPRLRGGVVYTFTTTSTRQYVHIGRTAGANVTAYLWTIGV